MLEIKQVKYMQNYHENHMVLKQAGINSPVAFNWDATFIVAHLAQAVFVNLNKFKIITS